jgi:hypothetical protein
MFRGLINDVKSAAGSLIVRYLARASVAAPFVIAAGFAIAAITYTLVARFGPIVACWLIAGGFTLIGLVAGVLVKVKEQEEEVAEKDAENADTAGVASEAATQAAMQAPLALVGALLSTSAGPQAIVGSAKVVLRNLPLVVLLALIALLFWPTEEAGAGVPEDLDEGDAILRGEPNGAYPPTGNGFRHERAA